MKNKCKRGGSVNSKSILLLVVLTLSAGIAVAAACYTYTTGFDCESAAEGCVWKQDSWGSYCEQKGCWNFETQSACNNANASINQSCIWNTPQNAYGWCESAGCPSFDGTNQSACETNILNLTCTWTASTQLCDATSCNSYTSQATCSANKTGYSGKGCVWDSTYSYCYESTCGDHDGDNETCLSTNGCTWVDPFCKLQGCWNHGDESTCTAQGCYWEADTNAGWCESPQCWQFDNISLSGAANESACINNTYGLNCNYEANGGWCWENFGTSCSDFTVEKDCLDTFHCFWNSTHCIDPAGTSIFDAVNPGCYVFDQSENACTNVTGCQWSSNECNDNGIDTLGVQCENITQQSMCNDIPVLGSCCKWQQGACTSTFETTCWDQIEEFPEGASYCEDYNAYNNEQLCNQIAGSPWFLPCEWNAASSACQFKSDDFFGGGQAKLIEIDNRQTCEAAGGQWLTDSYCDANGNAVSSGRCERKFDQERNCNKACYACEYKNTGAAWDSAADAQTACQNSKVGCEWTTDSNAPNGLGFCSVTEAIKLGLAGDCSTDCAGCSHLSNAQTECAASAASCKWDPTVSQCVKKSEKTCADACDKCYDSTNCVSNGRGGNNACTWSDTQQLCQPASGSTEICWNGIDDDDDSAIDCADSQCFGSSDCGGSGANCFAHANNETCNADGNCTWFEDTWGSFCEFAGALCWKNDGDESSCNAQSGCTWFAAHGGGECDVNWTAGESCWQQLNGTSCNATSGCTWVSDQFGSFCESSLFSGGANCFDYDNNPTACNAADGCRWFTDQFGGGGWCDPEIGNSLGCFNDSINNQSACEALNGCEWEAGFCDPEGFGGGHGDGGGFFGLQCFVYNGNQTGCESQDGCSYFTNPAGGFCDIGKSCSNPVFNQNETLCTNAGCTYSNASGFGECYNPKESCFRNMTLQTNSTACDASAHCNWTTDFGPPRCEPTCFENIDESSCGAASGCIWLGGFCEDAANAGHFDGMEGGAPVALAGDEIGDAPSNYTDIVGLGMKDMGDQFGFGVPVVSLTEAAGCNGKYINGAQAQGTQSHDLYVYLDTDGSASGSCSLHSNSSAAGYEFYFTIAASLSNNQVSDQITSYRCNSGSWVVADIDASTFWSLVCQEIGGYMISITKADLNKFSSLYDASADMRIFAATANNTANTSSPSDTVGPAWVTPGAVDFEIADFASLGSNSQYEDIFKQGFVSYENCYNSIDDDNDGLIDCNDYDCTYENICDGTGVNADNFVDTRSPLVTGVKKENYPDSALIMYDTNKPANGSILFYGNGTSCTNINATIDDIGITSTNVRQHKTWHYGIVSSETVGFDLQALTNYSYKLQICDDNNKCAISKCTQFKTSSVATCKYCDFAARLKAPTGWSVFYDTNNDSVIDHAQGQVCGENAGMGINYTTGRTVDIYLLDSTNSSNGTGMIFKNALVTKSALNDKVRDFDGSGEILSTTTTVNGQTVSYTGLPTSTRDKIINNLVPEQCFVRLPVPSGGCTSTLWHCDDDVTTCSERSDVNLTNTTSSYCEYSIPFCQFSVWSTGNAVASGSSSSSSSSGGGSGAGGAGGSVPSSSSELSEVWEPFTVSELVHNPITLGGVEHIFIAKELNENSAVVEIRSDPIILTVQRNEVAKVKLEGGTLEILYEGISALKGIFDLRFITDPVEEEAPVEEEPEPEPEAVEEQPEEQQQEQSEHDEEKKKSTMPIIALSIIVLAAILALAFIAYKKHHH